MVCSFFDTSLYMTIPQIWDTFEMRASINDEITFRGPDPRLSSTYDSSIIWACNPLEVRTRSKGNVEPSPNFHGHRHLIVMAPCLHGGLVSATESIRTNSSIFESTCRCGWHTRWSKRRFHRRKRPLETLWCPFVWKIYQWCFKAFVLIRHLYKKQAVLL